ncbi:hypothetical protein BJX70DRAFT_291886 [Aspergillus crustosus]
MESQEPQQEDPSEISWPTLFFWMACFALNSISQPSGRVLGTPYRHQSILRGSPIICAFDAINIVASWLIHLLFPIARPAGVRLAATRVLLQRFIDEQGNPDLPAIKSLQAQSRARWVGFLLGVLPSAIKLFASKGIPYSQAAGAMFLSSWLFFEILFLAAELDDTTVQAIQTLSLPNEEVIRKTWAIAGIILHMIPYGLPVSSLRDILTKRNRTIDYFALYTPFSIFAYPLWSRSFSSNPENPVGKLTFLSLFVMAVPQFIFPFFDKESSFAGAYYLLFLIGLCVASLVLGYLVLRWASEVVVLLQVFSVLAQPLFFYLFLYEAAGTFQPAWLRWLG